MSPERHIFGDDEALQLAQYSSLRAQVPLMYTLIFFNALFAAWASYGKVSFALSVALPISLFCLIGARAFLWVRRGKKSLPSAIKTRRYLIGTVAASVINSAAFGGWGYLLMSEVDPAHSSVIALYVFIGCISCCYCLHALPVTGWIVILFGALPVTAKLILASDPFLRGIGLAFLIASGVILRSLAQNYNTFKSLLRSRSEMAALITALEASQEHHRYSVELNPQIPWITDAAGGVVEVSSRWVTATGTNLEDALGWRWTDAVHPDDVARVLKVWNQALTAAGNDRHVDVRYRLKHAAGGFRWFRGRARPRLDEHDNVLAWYGNLEDIDDQVRAECALQDSEERYRFASMASNDIIWDVSLVHDTVQWSGAAVTVLGYHEALEGTSIDWCFERIHHKDRARVMSEFARVRLPGTTQWQQEFRFKAANGTYLNLVARGYVVRDTDGVSTRLIGSLQDVTGQKQYEDKLRWSAHHDALTNLPNRALFAERLEAALEDARRNGTQVQLVVLDVDRFKATNDRLGHDAGDALLREIANRLVLNAPAAATVARLGGDEFAVIIPMGIDSRSTSGLIDDLLAKASAPVAFRGRQLDVSFSAGSAVAFDDGHYPEELHKSADLALYAAKGEGTGIIRCFHPDMRESAKRQTRMLFDARDALLNDRIVPFYQPKVCLSTGACVGFEALLRWHHATGIRHPADIGAALADSGIAVKLTDRILDRVIADLVNWRSSGIDVGAVAINSSTGDFQRGDFADRVLERLHRAGLPPAALEIEVTETVFIGQLGDTVNRALATLSKAGVAIALDDFGTGYASLTHLQEFPVNTLKIDRSFISRLDDTEREDAAIVRAVVDLARRLNLKTVGEGVESPSQAGHLASMSCDVGQGFLFGKPTMSAHIPRLISSWDAGEVLAKIRADTKPMPLSA